MSQLLRKDSQMSDPAKAAVMIQQIIPDDGGYVATRITSAWKFLHRQDRFDQAVPENQKDRWSHSLVYNIWYARVFRVDAWAMETLRRAIELNQCEQKNAAQELETARNEYQELRERCAQLEASLSIKDQDFYSPYLDALALKLAKFITPEIADED